MTFASTVIMLVIATINDLINRKIKNIIPFTFIFIGIFMNTPENSLKAFLFSLLLFIVLFAVPRTLKINEFMGAGDIKLYMAVSFIMGWHFALYAFVYSIFVGAVILPLINIKRMKEIIKNVYFFVTSKGKWNITETQEKTNIFAPYILIGAILHHILQINWII